jgi:hypothetical protein
MKKHSGMRPLDIAILLKLAAYKPQRWLIKDLSAELFISKGEISESLNRSLIADFLAPDKRVVTRQNLLEFLEHGLRFVFPQKPGALVSGIPTAHSAPPLNNNVFTEFAFVWPHPEGKIKGQCIEPLYPNAFRASLKDKRMYEMLALTDAL